MCQVKLFSPDVFLCFILLSAALSACHQQMHSLSVWISVFENKISFVGGRMCLCVYVCVSMFVCLVQFVITIQA